MAHAPYLLMPTLRPGARQCTGSAGEVPVVPKRRSDNKLGAVLEPLEGYHLLYT